jgi:hypothetical protein
VFKTEECLEKATECEEIAQAEDQDDIKIYYVGLSGALAHVGADFRTKGRD